VAELTRAEETIRREQQQLQEMRQRETELVQAKDGVQQKLREKEKQLECTEALVTDLKIKLTENKLYKG
jgi:hypothetical protein